MPATTEVTGHQTEIPGLLIFDVTHVGDERGYFQEKFHKAKLVAAGMPEKFQVVQNSLSYNKQAGVTRGFHAEPWDKYIGVVTGRVFSAYVDLRKGDTFGKVVTVEITPDKAVFLPEGVANSFQTLEDDTYYLYSVSAHWSADNLDKYTFANLADPDIGVKWPIPLDQAVMSDRDRNHPPLKDVNPLEVLFHLTERRYNMASVSAVDDSKVFIVGANGQLGTALRAQYPGAQSADIDELDITKRDSVLGFDWSNISIILNAAGFTNVDGAESAEGRVAAWKVNATAVSYLAEVARQHDITLVHISTDYVFDGTQNPHTETEDFAPLSVYGASKAAGDVAAGSVPKHYILRTSWVIGEGKNFVRTMLGVAEKGVSPTVVADQIGCLTFTSELVRAIDHLLTSDAAPGTYNLSNDGEPAGWAAITRQIFKLAGHDELTVTDTTTAEYFAGKEGIAPRPLHSALDLSKIHATGFTSHSWQDDLKAYIDKEKS